jgi:hypothetical protein
MDIKGTNWMEAIVNQLKKHLRNMKVYELLKANPLLAKVNAGYRAKQTQEKSKKLQEHGLQALALMKEALLATEHEFWLDYGTLLGAIREKDFIGHDFDIDFGVLYISNEKVKQLGECLLTKGFSKSRTFDLDGRIVEETYLYEGVHIDLFYYESSAPGKVSCYSLEAGEHTKYTYPEGREEITNLVVKKITSSFNGTTTIDFKGHTFPVPANHHEYLTDNYGETYMIKNANWDWTTSVSNFEVLNHQGVTKAVIYK